MGELTRELNNTGTAIGASPVSPERLATLLRMVEQGTVSLKVARDIFPEMYRTGKAPEQIVQENGLTQMSDEGALSQIIDEVLASILLKLPSSSRGNNRYWAFWSGR